MLGRKLLFFGIVFLIGTISLFASEGRLLRFPDVYKDQVAFVYAGDIWISSTSGGQAHRLTTDEGLELFPKFSPDGKYIAFTGEYDGNRDVYVIPVEGGEPKRLTYSLDMGKLPDRMGADNLVLGWTPDSKNILYRSRRQSINAWTGQLYTVNINGGFPVRLPVPRGGYTTYSPDGNKIAYNRLFREFRTWKRYRGGQADDVWIYDLKSGALENITNNPAQDNFPMWSGNKIYFLSDRDHSANLFVYDQSTKESKKLTNYSEYDIKYPSLGAGAIAYENGGFIYLLDLATEQTHKLTIELNDDRKLTRAKFVNPKNLIKEYDLSPDGKRALFVARGEIFTVPAEKGNTRNLTNTSGAHEKNAYWSPDGKYIAYISDSSGEDEIYITLQDGSAPPTRITTHGNCYLFDPRWSPDGKKLAFSDVNHTLSYIDLASKKITQIDNSSADEIHDYNWSPDSNWICYSRIDFPSDEVQGFSIIQIYSLSENKKYPVTNNFTCSYSPTFDPAGKYLYFLSDRDLNASIGGFEYNFSYQKPTKIFAVNLQTNTPSLLAPESDEVQISEKKTEEKQAKIEELKTDLRIDIAGIQDRIVGLRMPSGNYTNLQVARDKIFYLSVPTTQLTETPTEQNTLYVYEVDKHKNTEVLAVDGYTLSLNGQKIIYKSKENYFLIDVKTSPAKSGEGTLNLSGMQMKLDYKAEWKQIFDEAWRLERDFFYAQNMHGVDWKLIHDRYAILLPYVSHRADLTYIIGEMIAELNIGHAYVGNGDLPHPESTKFGLLGAEFEPVKEYYRIKKIYSGENWTEDRRSPLTEPGINVKEGDYILAIDGNDLKIPTNPYSLLEGKNGITVTLKINSVPSLVGAREVKVKTIENETQLRYFNWVENNRRYVEQKTQGKVGYVHIPDMSGEGLNEFVKYFYPQIHKEGLIIDDRYNGGGNVSRMIIERLRRSLGALRSERGGGTINTYPDGVFVGPMVCLLNELSASDGDIFPYMFRQYKLGKLIGKRSWGGVIGIRGLTQLIDGGYVTMPNAGFYGTSGEWIIEGHGVDPDIVVDNPPMDEFNGKDAQLDKAIEEVLNEMKNKPAALPKRPADPVRN